MRWLSLAALFVALLAFQPSCDDGGGPCKPEVVASLSAQQIYVDEQRLVFVHRPILQTCPKEDCSQPTTLLTFDTNEYAKFVVDSGNVYVARRLESFGPTRIERCAVTGCDSTPTPVVPQEVDTNFVIDRGLIYYGVWTPAGAEIRRCSVDGCGLASATVISRSERIGSIAIDAAKLYWESPSGTYSCPLGACSSPTHITSFDTTIVGVDADHVYFEGSAYKGTVVSRCALGGCALPESVVYGYDLAFGMDGTSLYYADFPPGGPKPLRRISKQLGPPVDVAGPTRIGSNLQFDAHCVYWSDNRAIQRAPK